MKLLKLLTISVVTTNILIGSVLNDINVEKSLDLSNRDFLKINSLYILQDQNSEKIKESKNSFKSNFNYSTASIFNENVINSYILYINAELNDSTIYIVEVRENVNNGKLFTIEREFEGSSSPQVLVKTKNGKQTILSFLEENFNNIDVQFSLVFDDNIISSYNGEFKVIAPLLYELDVSLRKKNKEKKISTLTYREFLNTHNYKPQGETKNEEIMSVKYEDVSNEKECYYKKVRVLQDIIVREKADWNSKKEGMILKKNAIVSINCNKDNVQSDKNGYKWFKIDQGYLPLPSLKDKNGESFTEAVYEN